MAHICVGNLTTIGSDNGLSPGRRQAIIWTKGGLLLIGPLGTNVSEILIETLTFSFKKMRLNVSSAKRRPFCFGPNVLSWVQRDPSCPRYSMKRNMVVPYHNNTPKMAFLYFFMLLSFHIASFNVTQWSTQKYITLKNTILWIAKGFLTEKQWNFHQCLLEVLAIRNMISNMISPTECDIFQYINISTWNYIHIYYQGGTIPTTTN